MSNDTSIRIFYRTINPSFISLLNKSVSYFIDFIYIKHIKITCINTVCFLYVRYCCVSLFINQYLICIKFADKFLGGRSHCFVLRHPAMLLRYCKSPCSYCFSSHLFNSLHFGVTVFCAFMFKITKTGYIFAFSFQTVLFKCLHSSVIICSAFFYCFVIKFFIAIKSTS